MTLQDKLNNLKANFEKSAPKEAVEIMHRATGDLIGIDLNKYNGDDSWTLPMPGRFIIDRSGVIRYAEVNPDYTVRPEPEEVIGILKELLP